MPRPPLVLSAHFSVWTADADEGERTAAGADTDPVACQFWGQPTMGWQEPFHLNDEREANLVASCPLCHLVQHLNRPDIDREAVLIWLPEMAQAALNVLVRQIHLACIGAGVSPILSDAGWSSSKPAAAKPLAAYAALQERSAVAMERLGTNSPRLLGGVLLDLRLDPLTRADLLGGLRLLPRGQLFRQGRDIYPAMLRDWSGQRANAA